MRRRLGLEAGPIGALLLQGDRGSNPLSRCIADLISASRTEVSAHLGRDERTITHAPQSIPLPTISREMIKGFMSLLLDAFLPFAPKMPKGLKPMLKSWRVEKTSAQQARDRTTVCRIPRLTLRARACYFGAKLPRLVRLRQVGRQVSSQL